MSDSEDSPPEDNDDVQANNNGLRKEEEYVDRKSIPKHLRRRYWTSWEEMRLIELWRQNARDIVALDKNIPVFRTIALAMKDNGFHLNAQEVRRKLNAIKNKYIMERRTLNSLKEEESQWRLYPFVHNIFAPAKPPLENKFNEEQALASILKETREDPMYNILLSGLPVAATMEKIEAGEVVEVTIPKKFEDSFPIENETLADSIAFGYANAHRLSFTPRYQRPSEIANSQAKMLAAAANSAPILGHSNSDFLKRKATMAAIAQLRSENRQLAEQCVIANKRLKQEELRLKAYEAFVEQIQMQYRNMFKKLVSTEA